VSVQCKTCWWGGSQRHARRWAPRCNPWGCQGTAPHGATSWQTSRRQGVLRFATPQAERCMAGSWRTTWARWAAQATLVRVWPRCHPRRPVGTTKEARQAAHTMAAIGVLAVFGLARWPRRGGKAALPPLQARFFSSAEDAAAFVGEAPRLERKRTDRLRLGLTVRSVAVEPVHAPVRLEGGLLQHAPEARATPALRPLLPACGDQVVQPPPGGRAMICGWVLGRHRQDRDARRGGKCAAGAPRAGHPAGPGSRAPDSADATGQPYGAHRPSRWPRAAWRVGLARQSGG